MNEPSARPDAIRNEGSAERQRGRDSACCSLPGAARCTWAEGVHTFGRLDSKANEEQRCEAGVGACEKVEHVHLCAQLRIRVHRGVDRKCEEQANDDVALRALDVIRINVFEVCRADRLQGREGAGQGLSKRASASCGLGQVDRAPGRGTAPWVVGSRSQTDWSPPRRAMAQAMLHRCAGLDWRFADLDWPAPCCALDLLDCPRHGPSYHVRIPLVAESVRPSREHPLTPSRSAVRHRAPLSRLALFSRAICTLAGLDKRAAQRDACPRWQGAAQPFS